MATSCCLYVKASSGLQMPGEHRQLGPPPGNMRTVGRVGQIAPLRQKGELELLCGMSYKAELSRCKYLLI